MDVESSSVAGLAVRFELRGRARRAEYLHGRSLAESGAVTVTAVEQDRVELVVAESEANFDVALVYFEGTLQATCTCNDAFSVCRHQVAAEHALWRQVTS